MDNVMFKEKKSQIKNAGQGARNSYINSAIGIIFLVISSFLIFNSVRSFQITRDKLAILEKARTDVTDFRLKNIQLILEKDKIETDDYTETDIRNRLNYSKKNEVLFVLSEQSVQTSLLEVKELLKEEIEIEKTQTNFEMWVSFFDGGI